MHFHDQAGSVDNRAIRKDTDQVKNECSKYEPRHIFNVDETGLFLRILLRRTYVVPSEKLSKLERDGRFVGEEAYNYVRLHERYWSSEGPNLDRREMEECLMFQRVDSAGKVFVPIECLVRQRHFGYVVRGSLLAVQTGSHSRLRR